MTSSIQTETTTPLRLRRGTAYNPWDHAAALGLQVIERRLERAAELWLPDYFTIVVHADLRDVHKRVVLAHGIGHAELAHRDDRPKHEHQADLFAAVYLVHPIELRSVAEWCGDDQDMICAELGITRRVLAAARSLR